MNPEASCRRPAAATVLVALGVVFGDIGTSPLYAFRECFGGAHAAPLRAENLVGAASLIMWSLILVVSLKYLFLVLRFDNRGEGGILALASLLQHIRRQRALGDARWILLLGLAGAALIYADGILTPAISVLSAVEGLAVVAPGLSHWTVPLTVGILIGLFSIQHHGTGKVGKYFGPIVLLWFAVLAALGASALFRHPQVLTALAPWQAVLFLAREWQHAFPLLGAVFLAVTGGEALYADLGHFGRRPIRIGWFSIVFPALALNYLGQAALLTADPTAVRSPFFLLAPEMLRLPLTVLAAAAAVIASQALVSGAFSLTTQAVQLGCLPRFLVRHTSDQEKGQVYVPTVNWALAAACILLVTTLGSSSRLAGAYGIAISLTMTITSVLLIPAARSVLGWSTWKTVLATVAFLCIDLAFLAANGLKIAHLGWLPLVVSAGIMVMMLIWLWGRDRLLARFMVDDLPIEYLLKDLSKGSIQRVPGMAVYLSGRSGQVPRALLHNLKHNKVIHEHTLLLHVLTLDEARSNPEERIRCEPLGEGLWEVSLRFGFFETPDVPGALQRFLPPEIPFKPGKISYFLGRETYRIGKGARLVDRVRLYLFALMARNASPANAYFNLPPGRVVELGAQVTI
jgi:KUP system potassium uptake protein